MGGVRRLGLLLLLLVSIAAPTSVLAGDLDINLALTPVGEAGPYFDLTMRPGTSRSLQVDIANHGNAAVAVRTYPSDVYTIINGGFGADLRDAEASGTTSWLAYMDAVLTLDVGQLVRRDVTVRVPADAAPGEYITSLVLENDEPIGAPASLGFDQVVRQAVAVVITVPGPRAPGLEIGAATHLVVAGTSILSIAVANTGNVRLKPLVGFSLVDAGGHEVSRATLQMGTFYARTDTTVELPLAALLAPGTYTVRLTLDDDVDGASAEASAIPLVVSAPSATPAVEPGGGAGRIGVIGGSDGGGLSPAGLGVLFGAAVLVAFGIAWLIAGHRRRARVLGTDTAS